MIVVSLMTLLYGVSPGQVNPARPNIVMVIGDDMRYDSFKPTGGPDWFGSPSINRIVEEGASFNNYFCVYSLCVPGRSSMLTGLYPHSNGATDNTSPYFAALPTIASILNAAGYHTAMIGKFQSYSDPQPGWDFWMARSKFAESYEDPKFNVNGVSKIIDGHVTQIIIDSANRVLAEIDTPFFVFIAHQAPHAPAIPLPADKDLYAGEEMPFPTNFYSYASLYPSFLYSEPSSITEEKLKESMQAYYECIKGLDKHLKSIFTGLTNREVLDNTLLMFTADNGVFFGEHMLQGKGLAYEPSIRLPMFIRYPEWFAPDTKVDLPIGLNVDVAPTILEAAGIDVSPYHFQGVSLHKLASGELDRDKMMYENIKLADYNEETDRPSIRTVRSKQYKYNWYQCTQQTEEFFDLVADPEENFNLINNPSYAGMIVTFRHWLDSMRIALHDTLTADSVVKPCYLVADRLVGSVYNVEDLLASFQITLNPFQEKLTINLTGSLHSPAEISVLNLLGQLVSSTRISGTDRWSSVTFDTSNLPGGMYVVRVTRDGHSSVAFALKE